jgi:hypothetical protein
MTAHHDDTDDTIATNDFVDAQGRAYWGGKLVCSQCGQEWLERACGPTHAVIAHEIQSWKTP